MAFVYGSAALEEVCTPFNVILVNTSLLISSVSWPSSVQSNIKQYYNVAPFVPI